MQFYTSRILAVILLGALAACNRASSGQKAANGAAERAQASPTQQDIPYNFVQRIPVAELRDALNNDTAVAVDTRP